MFHYDLAVPPLPFAPRPFSEELLLSWICRLAAANQVGLSRFLPQVQAMGRYRLNWDPGEAVVAQLAAMARLPQSALQNLLLPNQFPNLSLLSFLQLPKLSSSFCGPSPTDFIPFPCCSDCAGNREFPACSPWDWILPMLHTKGVKELMRRVSKWPLILQLPVTSVSRGLATGRVRRNVY